MKDASVIISAIAALFSAVLWPALLGVCAYYLRKQLRDGLEQLPSLLQRTQSLKFGYFEAQLAALADKTANEGDKKGEVTPEQVHLAASLKVQARMVGTLNVTSEMDRLGIEYDAIRGTMKSSLERTRQMSRIVVQMRALGPSVSTMIDVYKSSGSPGSRLAAVVMMQMEPEKADLPWLQDRFKKETPFIFYHASLALQNVINSSSKETKNSAIQVAGLALDTIQSFSGVPDRDTLMVLQAIIRQGEQSNNA